MSPALPSVECNSNNNNSKTMPTEAAAAAAVTATANSTVTGTPLRLELKTVFDAVAESGKKKPSADVNNELLCSHHTPANQQARACTLFDKHLLLGCMQQLRTATTHLPNKHAPARSFDKHLGRPRRGGGPVAMVQQAALTDEAFDELVSTMSAADSVLPAAKSLPERRGCHHRQAPC